MQRILKISRDRARTRSDVHPKSHASHIVTRLLSSTHNHHLNHNECAVPPPDPQVNPTTTGDPRRPQNTTTSQPTNPTTTRPRHQHQQHGVRPPCHPHATSRHLQHHNAVRPKRRQPPNDSKNAGKEDNDRQMMASPQQMSARRTSATASNDENDHDAPNNCQTTTSAHKRKRQAHRVPRIMNDATGERDCVPFRDVARSDAN